MQQALRRALGELMQQFTDLSGEASPGLGEADQAMRDSATQLEPGQDQARRPVAAAGDRRAAKGQPGDGPGDGQEGPATGQGQGEEGDDGDQDGRGRYGHDDAGWPARRRPRHGPLPGSPDRADPSGRDPLGRYNQGNSTDNADVAVPEERERQTHPGDPGGAAAARRRSGAAAAGTGLYRSAAEAVLIRGPDTTPLALHHLDRPRRVADP